MFRALPLDRIRDSLSLAWSLNKREVLARRERYGFNNIIEKPSGQILELIKNTLLDPMIWFLFIASLLFGFLGQASESIILLLAIIPIGGMDAFLHWRTQVSTQALSSRLVTYARVLRDGVELVIPIKEIVPGDLVSVKAGEYFPADGIVLDAKNLQVDESSLTGEAFPVSKAALHKLPIGQVEPLINYRHWGFVGTRILTGFALVRVVYTGHETIYGEIVTSVMNTHQDKTPLQKAIMHLVVILLFVSIVFCAILAIVRYIQGFGIIDALLSAATLAVAALPDEFPMVFTFFLGVGVYRLAKKHALVRRAVSVENIGRITCICTDKTGTLTEGQFHIAECLPIPSLSKQELINLAAHAARADSSDPLDLAILAKVKPKEFDHQSRLHVFPFTEERKRETSLYKLPDSILVVTKGAPETIFKICNLTSDDESEWRDHVNEYAEQGYKVIACARYFSPTNINILEEPTANYEFVGLIAFSDPPRKEVYAAVQSCQKHAIHVLMITGDHPITASKIAMEIGLGSGAPNIITADNAVKLLKENGAHFLYHVDVIARALPSQKFTFVKALREMGEIVAVTGDGVNDVPALREADVGIAMGERGTQSAREAASIVLLDDNFGSIVNAINEGKQLFKNLQLSFKYLLMVHAPYIFSATIIPLLGFPLLYYPIHIVWIELFIHPTCMLVFQNLPSAENKRYEESHRGVTFFNRFDWYGIAWLSFFTSAGVVFTYLLSLHFTGNDDIARANAFTLVGLSHIALTIGLSKLQSKTSRVIVIASFVMLLFLVQIPVIAHYFNMQPPSILTWLLLSAYSFFTAIFAYKVS